MLQKLSLKTKVFIAIILLGIMLLLSNYYYNKSLKLIHPGSSMEIEELMPTVEEHEHFDTTEFFMDKEELPEFPGGQKELFKFIGENVKVPSMARGNSTGGTVYVSFMVMEDGSIEDIHIKKGMRGIIGEMCNKEAIRVVKLMPNWKPAKNLGELVPMAFTLPIRFKLE